MGQSKHAQRIKTDWKHVHEQLLALAARRAELDADEGPWLLAALRAGVHAQLGYGSFQEYIERLFGYSPRFVAERLRVARALEELPQMQQAQRSGALKWSALRELTRVATPETESAWLDAARGKSLREVERLVGGKAPGARPEDAPRAEYQRHVLRFEVSAETRASYREALAKLRRDSNEPLDEDSALLLMARHVLEGPKDSGRAGYQIAITLCEACKQGYQHGRGEALVLEPEIVEMAGCDAQTVELRDGAAAAAVHAATEPSEADAERRDGAAAAAVHTATEPSEAAAEQPGTGAHAQSQLSTHAPAYAPTASAPKGRAQQTIPPAIRREVMRRDGGRCAVGSCRNAVFVDVHHIVPRADGGAHDPEQMLVLCGAHHRALHKGRLIIEGRASTGFRILHADGTPYGTLPNPLAAQTAEEAFAALRQLGFRQTEVQRALEQLRRSGQNSSETSSAELIRAALRLLVPQAPAGYRARAHSQAAPRAGERRGHYGCRSMPHVGAGVGRSCGHTGTSSTAYGRQEYSRLGLRTPDCSSRPERREWMRVARCVQNFLSDPFAIKREADTQHLFSRRASIAG